MKKIIILIAALAVSFSANAQVAFGVKVGGNFSNVNVGVSGVSANVNTGYKVGGYIGGNAEIGLGGNFYLQPELIYSYGGAQVSISDKFINELANSQLISGGQGIGYDIPSVSASVNTSTFRLPVLVKYKTSDGLSILAGPYVSFGLITGANFSKSVYDELIPNTVRAEASYRDPAPSDEEIKAKTDEITSIVKDYIEVGCDVLKDNIVKLDFGATIGAEYEFSNGAFIEARYNFGFNSIVPSTIDTGAINAFRIKQVEGSGGTWDSEDNIPSIVLKDYIGDIKILGRRSSIQIGVGFRF